MRLIRFTKYTTYWGLPLLSFLTISKSMQLTWSSTFLRLKVQAWQIWFHTYLTRHRILYPSYSYITQTIGSTQAKLSSILGSKSSVNKRCCSSKNNMLEDQCSQAWGLISRSPSLSLASTLRMSLSTVSSLILGVPNKLKVWQRKSKLTNLEEKLWMDFLF